MKPLSCAAAVITSVFISLALSVSPPSFLRRFSPICVSCNDPIIPDPGSEETVRVVALEKNFHLKCYRCEVMGPLHHPVTNVTPTHRHKFAITLVGKTFLENSSSKYLNRLITSILILTKMSDHMNLNILLTKYSESAISR